MSIRESMIDLYRPDDNDFEIYGESYIPPEEFQHARWHLVATFKNAHEAFVYEMRMPVSFFKIVCNDKGILLSTGSGHEMGKLAMQLAEAASIGMIGAVTPDSLAHSLNRHVT